MCRWAWNLASLTSNYRKTTGGKSKFMTRRRVSVAIGLSCVAILSAAARSDPSVVGSDRKLAIRLLRFMPASSRGDFVYVDPANGKIIYESARVSERKLTPTVVAPVIIVEQLVNAASSVRQTRSYPPVGGGGGTYIRHYSAQGVNAASGYATVPCNARLSGGDHGFMYFNAYSQSSSGSVIDAGLEIYPGNIPHPFINEGGYLYSGWTDENSIPGTAESTLACSTV